MDTPSAPVTPVHKNVFMGALAYIGPLVVVSYFVAKDDPFVKFHIKQGLVLFVIEIAMWFFSMLLLPLWMLLQLVNIAVLILAIIGILNAAKGEEKELPLVGSLARHFTF